MGFLTNLKATLGITETEKRGLSDIEERSGHGGIGALMFGGTSSYTHDKAMLLSATYRCVELISSSVAQLPFEVFKIDSEGYKKKWERHPAYHILNCEPNVRMTRFTLMKLLVQSMLLRGNGYAYILRDDKGDVSQLLFIPSEYVTIIPPKYIYEPVKYRITGFNFDVESKDMIHILNYSYDGVVGISTLQFARHTMELASNADEHARNFYGNGCAIGGILKANTSLNPKQKEDIKQSWNQAFGTKSGGQTNGVAVLGGEFDYQNISLSEKDNMSLETRRYSVEDICRFFNVSPLKCFDLSHANYSSAEIANLSFLSETLQPILDKIELEFKRKLFREHSNLTVKFDVSELLRTDKASQSAYFRELISNGILAPNEARKMMDMLPIEGGDKTYMQSNMMSLESISSNIPANSAVNNPMKEEGKEKQGEIEEPTKEEETQD